MASRRGGGGRDHHRATAGRIWRESLVAGACSWTRRVSRNTVLAASAAALGGPGFTECLTEAGNPRPRSGLRGRATGRDGASRSRYTSVGRSGGAGGGGTLRRLPSWGPGGHGGEPARPEEPSARTPARGRPAGALRWRVTVANRSVAWAEEPGEAEPPCRARSRRTAGLACGGRVRPQNRVSEDGREVACANGAPVFPTGRKRGSTAAPSPPSKNTLTFIGRLEESGPPGPRRERREERCCCCPLLPRQKTLWHFFGRLEERGAGGPDGREGGRHCRPFLPRQKTL